MDEAILPYSKWNLGIFMSLWISEPNGSSLACQDLTKTW
jgi:hypothetical protein